MNSQGKRRNKTDKTSWRRGIREGFDGDGGVVCRRCFEKDRQIEELREELRIVKAKLVSREKMSRKDVIGAHTPSSKISFKENSKCEDQNKFGGAKPGHK